MGKSWPKCFIPPLVQTRQNSGNVAIDRVIERGCCGQGGGKYVIFLGEISTGKKIRTKIKPSWGKKYKKECQNANSDTIKQTKKMQKIAVLSPLTNQHQNYCLLQAFPTNFWGCHIQSRGWCFVKWKFSGAIFNEVPVPKGMALGNFNAAQTFKKNHTSKILQQDPIQADAHSGGQRNQSKCTQGKGVSDRNKWQSSYACTAKGCMHWGRGVAKLWLGWNECFT